MRDVPAASSSTEPTASDQEMPFVISVCPGNRLDEPTVSGLDLPQGQTKPGARYPLAKGTSRSAGPDSGRRCGVKRNEVPYHRGRGWNIAGGIDMTETERIPGYCALCTSRCGSIAVVENGRFVALEPDPTHPTGQALCSKGRAAPELVYHPDRLRHPLKRT